MNTNAVVSGTVEKMPTPEQAFRKQLTSMETQFSAALPAHIPVERFVRVVQTAVQQNPALLKADRRSLWNSAMRAAQDGLLPDGREGAIVCYGTQAQWMPMIAGIRKKVRNSGEIATWDAHVVCENDEFIYELGDDPKIVHRPAMGDRGKPIGAYSIAVLKSGEKSREVMSFSEIEAIRSRSKAKGSGPWVTDWAEMARKTVARRHSKVLPMNTDLDDVMRRDDDLYDFKGAAEQAKQQQTDRASLSSRLDALAGSAAPQIEHQQEEEHDEVADRGEAQGDAQETGAVAADPALDHNPETGEVIEGEDPSAGEGTVSPRQEKKADAPKTKTAAQKPAQQQGHPAPTTDAEYVEHMKAWARSMKIPADMRSRWRSEAEMRVACKVTNRTTAELQAWLGDILAMLES